MPTKSKGKRAARQSRSPRIRRRYSPLDVRGLKLHSIHDRQHLSQVDLFADVPPPGTSFFHWLDSLPAFLGVNRLKAAVDAIVASRKAGRPVVFAMGGHVIKVGCGPVVIDLCRRGIVTALACHGATAIHDVELAMIGATSEDVGDTIRDGRFGMVRETAAFFAEAAREARRCKIGYGESIGRLILERSLPYSSISVLACAASLGIPATVHVAIGTDTIHASAMADGALIGQATLRDFRLLCRVAMDMAAPRKGQPAGTWCNIGSAVILPEVFLKVISVARNLGADLDRLTTVNLDMLRQYRTMQNVVTRPVARGQGHDLAGHHEIMLPLLRQAIIEQYPVHNT